MHSYLFRHGKTRVPFGQKWKISAPGTVINNPKIIDLFRYKFYVGPYKGVFVPKQYTFSLLKVHLRLHLVIKVKKSKLKFGLFNP